MTPEGEIEKDFEIIEDKDHAVFDENNNYHKVWKTRKADFVLWSMMGTFRYVFDEKGAVIAEFLPAGGDPDFNLVSVELLERWISRVSSYGAG